MEKDRDNIINSENIIIADFKSCDSEVQNNKVNVAKHHTNPIVKRLISLTHTKLVNRPHDYKSFSKFSPDDLI